MLACSLVMSVYESFGTDVAISVVCGLISGVLSGLLVYWVTDRRERERNFEIRFDSDQQALSRALGQLSVFLGELERGEESARLQISAHIENWPYTLSFKKTPKDITVFSELAEVKSSIEDILQKSEFEETQIKRVRGKLHKCRIAILRLNWKDFM